MAQRHEESLLRSLRWLQTSNEYSDLKIFCQDRVFQVHKAVVCSRSKYFATSCKWGKDSEPKEEIELVDDDAILVGLMLDYLYQLDYDDLSPSQVVTQPAEEAPGEPEGSKVSNLPNFKYQTYDEAIEPPAPEPVAPPAFSFMGNTAGSTKMSRKEKKKKKSSRLRFEEQGVDLNVERLVVNTLVYALADKFEIEDLKSLAKEKFAVAVEQDWKSMAFVHAAELAFETTPSSDQGLRAVVIQTFSEHRELVNYEQVQKLLDSGNGMAWAFVKHLLSDEVEP